MIDRDALLAAVLANPDDDLPRLAYADWLEEHGEADRAELIREMCAKAGGEIWYPHRLKHASGCPRRGLWREDLPDGFARSDGCERCRREVAWDCYHARFNDEARLRQLLDLPDGFAVRQVLLDYDAAQLYGPSLPLPQIHVERGFAAGYFGPAAAWLAHGDAILAAHPVRRVRLTDWPAVRIGWRIEGLTGRVLQAGRGWGDRWPGVAFELPPEPVRGGMTINGRRVPIRDWSVGPVE